jgi:hypothetical protein
MGHVDTRMLSRVYQHLSHYPQNLQQAVRRAQSKAVKCPLADQVFENNPDFFAR